MEQDKTSRKRKIIYVGEHLLMADMANKLYEEKRIEEIKVKIALLSTMKSNFLPSRKTMR